MELFLIVVAVIGAVAGLITIYHFRNQLAKWFRAIFGKEPLGEEMPPISVATNPALFSALERMETLRRKRRLNEGIVLNLFEKNIKYSEGGITSNVFYTFTGYNSSAMAKNGLDLIISGGSAITFPELQLKAIYKDPVSGSEEQVTPRILEERPLAKHIFIPFPTLLEPNKQFELVINYRWRCAIMDEEDSTYYTPLQAFPSGVQLLKTKMHFVNKPTIIGIYRVNPRKKKATPLFSLKTSSTSSPFIYKWQKENPEEIYIMWRKVKLN